MYVDSDSAHLEDESVSGVNEYGRLKVRAENILRQSNAKFVFLRLANIYGEGQPVGRSQGVISEWLHSLKTQRRPIIYGSPHSQRDFVHVSDVARAFINVLECPHINLTINIGSGTSTSLSELMKIFENSLGKPINWNFQPLRIIDRLRFLLDIQLASELLGWVPGVNLEEGIRALLENSNKII